MRVIVRILHVEEQQVEGHEPDLLSELLEEPGIAPARLDVLPGPAAAARAGLARAPAPAAAPRAVDHVVHRRARLVPGGPPRAGVRVHEVPVDLAPGRLQRAVGARQIASSTSSTRSRTTMRPSCPDVL